jgi:hypothetical protein
VKETRIVKLESLSKWYLERLECPERDMGTEVTSETLLKIYDSCITQKQPEKTHIFTPTRHILQTIKRIWNIVRTHCGLTAVAAPTFFSSASRNKETWWEKGTGETTGMSDLKDGQSKDDSGETEYMWDSTDEQDEEDTKKTAYFWDSMDEQDREDTMMLTSSNRLTNLTQRVIWKSKDKWFTSLQAAGFHQLLHIHQDIQDECWGFNFHLRSKDGVSQEITVTTYDRSYTAHLLWQSSTGRNCFSCGILEDRINA